MSISKPILYGNWRSSSSQRVRIGLGLKGIEFDYRPIDLSRAEQTSDAFRHIHPGAQVPVLLIDGLTLSQSVPILEFLDERFADRGVRLLPDTIEHRFAAREIAAFVASFMQPFQLPGVTRRRMVDAFGLESHELGADGACRRFAKCASRGRASRTRPVGFAAGGNVLRCRRPEPRRLRGVSAADRRGILRRGREGLRAPSPASTSNACGFPPSATACPSGRSTRPKRRQRPEEHR